MGLDFVRKAAKPFHKSLDHRRAELNTPDLFITSPELGAHYYTATILPKQRLMPGDVVRVRLQDNKVIALKGIDPVAVFDSPPTSLIDALKASYSEAEGTVGDVYEEAGIAEISVC